MTKLANLGAQKSALLNELEGAQRTLMNFLERDDLSGLTRDQIQSSLDLLGEGYGHVAGNTPNPEVLAMIQGDVQMVRQSVAALGFDL